MTRDELADAMRPFWRRFRETPILERVEYECKLFELVGTRPLGDISKLLRWIGSNWSGPRPTAWHVAKIGRPRRPAPASPTREEHPLVDPVDREQARSGVQQMLTTLRARSAEDRRESVLRRRAEVELAEEKAAAAQAELDTTRADLVTVLRRKLARRYRDRFAERPTPDK